MATTKWDELPPRTRRLIVLAGGLDGALKIAALADLARRPPAQVRGSKLRWASAITLINSLGTIPLAYFTYGRRKATTKK